MRPFYVYILQCADGSYYVGHTDEIDRRLAQHHAGETGGYTARRLPVEVSWLGEFPSRADAIERERQIKGWTRAKKEALARADWSQLHELAKCRSGPSTPVAQRARDLRSGRTE